MERGKIVHKERSQQVLDFTGLQWGKITPTNIDMSVDFGGKLFMFGETKLKGTPLLPGQRWHLELLVEACKYPAVAYITEHEVYDTSKEVDMARTIVKERFSNTQHEPRWIQPESDNLLLRDEMDRFKRHIDSRNGNGCQSLV